VVAVPTMLRTRLVIYFAAIMRVRCFEKILDKVHSIVEEIVVGLSNVDVKFSLQFGTKLLPIAAKNVA
jgi:hypothetical protein